MSHPKEYGEFGVRRNPRVGSPVRFAPSPDVRGRIDSEKTFEGVTSYHVTWHNGPVRESWHPANGLLVDESLS